MTRAAERHSAPACASPPPTSAITRTGRLARDPDALFEVIVELREMFTRHEALMVEAGELEVNAPRSLVIDAIIEAERPRYHELRELVARTRSRSTDTAICKAMLAIEMLSVEFSGDPEATSEDWDSPAAVGYSALLDLIGGAGA